MNSHLLKNVYILNPGQSRETNFDFYKGSILVKNGIIQKIFKENETITPPETDNIEVLDNHFRRLVFPGFIQSHIHFCQTLHRNLAEEMPLMEWLKKEIWPYEAAHTAQSMGKSVMMSLKEILSSGTTAVLDMGTVHHQEVIFDIMARVGFRYTGGKAMMDRCEGAPKGLAETTDDSIRHSMDLYEKFHGAKGGLLHYAFAPRFVLSCSTELLKEVRRLSDEKNIIIHTHASEHPEEVAFIKETFGQGNIAYLDKIGALNQNTVIAHMVHLDGREKELIGRYNLSVAHCPTTNLKLGSGVAPIAEYLEKDVWVGLGSDGAPCNNSLSIFNELKLAPLLQKGINNDPLLVQAEKALRMVSLNGAKIIRQDGKVGKIAENMEADFVLLDMETPQTYNFERNPAAAIVYGADARNVYGTMVKGRFLYLEGKYSDEIEELDGRYGSNK
ncbi:MAG: amidohydrolase family protein [bacterium]|nr:amidohydrolase family protein [bacterium]